MNSKFQTNLKELTKLYTQKQIAEKTGFSQSSINNYLCKDVEPSIQFLVALKNAFGVGVDDFLFSDFKIEQHVSYERYEGNYLIYYYNNDSYKGEVHTNLKNTLNYGVLSIYKNKEFDKDVNVSACFVRDRMVAIKLLKKLNSQQEQIQKIYDEIGDEYVGKLSVSDQNIFLDLFNKNNGDKSFIVFNNPPTKQKYIGGVGTVNSISRGREHNPCVQFVIISKKIIDVPDGEIYNLLKFDDYFVNMDFAIKDIIELFKRLYSEKAELSIELTEAQKQAIVRNKLEYHFNEILEANAFSGCDGLMQV
ncbi:MAG: helix-turn-helix transcriptional regulator, partial [Christensenellales bacterium]